MILQFSGIPDGNEGFLLKFRNVQIEFDRETTVEFVDPTTEETILRLQQEDIKAIYAAIRLIELEEIENKIKKSK